MAINQYHGTTMNRQEFFKKIPSYIGDNELDYIKNAYWLSKLIHRGQMRDSGERYFEHPRRVALNAIKYSKERVYLVSEIVLAFLHDGEEDGFPPEGLLERLFGPNIYRGLTLLSKMIPHFDKKTSEITKTKKNNDDYYRAIAKDPWPVIRRIKIFDRLDNISSMSAWPKERQEKYLKETYKYVLPLAKDDPPLKNALQKACDRASKKLNKNIKTPTRF